MERISQQSELNVSPALGHWFLVYTKPRQEQCAKENLERQAYECFLPLIKVQKIRAGKCIEETESLFPRYMFIRLIEGLSNFGPIRSTKGVSGLVKFSGVPARVPDQLIETLQQEPQLHEELFQPGDPIKVVAGPFMGFEAECIKLQKMKDGEMRALVLLDFLSKKQRVSMPLTELQKVI
jgi:transcriptional antiterminator RfaH